MVSAIWKSIVCLSSIVAVSFTHAASAPPDATGGANSYPSKPIRIIVPSSVGGGSDLLARVLSQKFYKSMGQPVIVDNRPGGGGIIGTDTVAHAPGDGYTLMFTTALLAVNPSLHRKIPFDTLRDLAPVGLAASVPLVLIAHPSVPAKSVTELIAFAKAGNGKVNYSINDTGSVSHLAGLLLKLKTGLDITAIPYKGGGDALNALLGGQVSFGFNTLVTALPQIKTGRVRVLAVTTPKRSRLLPDVPTMNSFIPGFELDSWYAMVAPAAVPRPIITRLNAELINALKAPDLQEIMAREGAEMAAGTPQQFGVFLKSEIEKYAKIIKQTGVQVD